MIRSKMSSALLVFSLFSLCSSSLSTRRDANDPLRLDQTNFVVRTNHRLMISCVYDGSDIGSMADLNWSNEKGSVIDGESSASVFTIALHEHGTHHKKKTLHFTQIQKRDAGSYVCSGRNIEGHVFKKTVEVHVLDAIEWNSNEVRTGGLVGEPLTVDCGAKGTPEPQIQVTDENGEPLDDQLFTQAGNEVSISALTKEYNGKTLNCVALQILDDLDTTSTEQRSVHIDVWYTPEFISDKIDRHTVLHTTAILPCNVTDSNPPTRHFNFFRNNKLLDDAKKYSLVMDVLENAAYLKVMDVGEDDLGEYHCEVNNGRAKATQIINLKEANPPDEVKVTLETVKKHGIVWKILTDSDDELPATKVEIQYIRKELIDSHLNDAQEKDAESVWNGQSSKAVRSIAETNLYEVSGLRANTDYVFRFRAESEAGFGPHVELIVSTNEEANTPVSSSSTFAAVLSSSLVTAALLRCLQ